jgi:hypothetical protein
MKPFFKPPLAMLSGVASGGFSVFMVLRLSSAPWIALCNPTSTKRSLSVELST